MLFHFHHQQKLTQHQKNAYRDIYNKNIRVYGHKLHGASPWPYIGLAVTVILIWYAVWTLVISRLWSAFTMTSFSSTVISSVLLTSPLGYVVYMITVPFGIWIGWRCMHRWWIANIGKNPKSLPHYPGDSYVMQPQDLPRVASFSIRADAGAWSRSESQPSGLLCHLPITTHDLFHHLQRVPVVQRVQQTHRLPSGQLAKRGMPILKNNGKPETKMLPIIDEDFSQDLLTASFVPKRKEMRYHYDPFKLVYNPNHQLGKANYKNVGQVIKHDWFLPSFEVERPGGIYVVDIAPDNTMVLAMTRAGKGQTIIEPTIDMWTRQLHKWNVVVNDPKGELYQEFYYPASRRGYEVIAFNLINERRTSIYNPLGYAVEANRQGDSQKAGQLISAIGSIFFPVTKGTDPMWPHAANAAFRRSALGLIDYYQDADNDMRARAAQEHWNPSILSLRLDQLWTHVCLYNVYKMMTTLASKNSGDIGNPKDPNDLGFICLTRKEKKNLKQTQAAGKDISKDYLTLFFDALQNLPRNAIRTAAIDQDNNLRSMSKSEKTLSSVYGIALSGMNFFTQDTISRLTSGRPSQNFDMEGLGFPRRIQVRFAHDYMTMGAHYLAGQRFRWDAFRGQTVSTDQKGRLDLKQIGQTDSDGWTPHLFLVHDIEGHYYHKMIALKKYKGADFSHTGDITENGWAPFIFKGKFKDEVSYLRLRIYNSRTHTLQETYYFQFSKDYLKSVDGATYVQDPVSHHMIVHGGILHELSRVPLCKADRTGRKHAVLTTSSNGDKHPVMEFAFQNTTYKKKRISLVQDKKRLPDYDPESPNYNTDATDEDSDNHYHFKSYIQNVHAFSQVSIHYTERPKMVFFITPPHMQQYARIILILLDQMFNVQVSRSYMTKKSQKPLYGTNYMLDEVGNLRSQGKGIPGLATKESIGLGQDQRYTLILQTVQQLRDIYGNSIDKVLQGNTKNIIYLKSTDDSMIKLLSAMAGTTHIRVHNNLSYHRNYRKITNQTGGQAGFSWSTKPVPLIPKDEFKQIPRDSSIVIGHNEPIVSRRQCALPMSWRLLKVQNSLHNYSFTTVPSTINNDAFNPLQNIPNFYRMVTLRVRQARLAPAMTLRYKKAHNLNDAQVSRIDDEVLSKELMENINAQLRYYKLIKMRKLHEKRERQENDREEAAENRRAMDQMDPADQLKEEEEMSNRMHQEDQQKIMDDYSDHDQHDNKAMTDYKHYSDLTLQRLHHRKFADAHFAPADLVSIHLNKKGKYSLNYQIPLHNYDNVIATAYSRTVDDFKADPKFQVTSDGSLILKQGTKLMSANTVLIVNAQDSKSHAKVLKELKQSGMFHNFNSNKKNMTDSNSILTKYVVTDNCIDYLASLDSWGNIAQGTFEREMARADDEIQSEK